MLNTKRHFALPLLFCNPQLEEEETDDEEYEEDDEDFDEEEDDEDFDEEEEEGESWDELERQAREGRELMCAVQLP